MADYSVQIENIDQIRAAFNKAPEKMVKELDKAIQKSVFEIEAGTKTRAPVRTGYMRASIRTTFTPLKGVLDWPDTSNPQGNSSRPAPVSLYSFFVHEGTRFMAARPFLFQAVEGSVANIQGYFKTSVQNVLDDIARDV